MGERIRDNLLEIKKKYYIYLWTSISFCYTLIVFGKITFKNYSNVSSIYIDGRKRGKRKTFNSNVPFMTVMPEPERGPGGPLAPPIFGRSVNPIRTTYVLLLAPSMCFTFRHHCMRCQPKCPANWIVWLC